MNFNSTLGFSSNLAGWAPFPKGLLDANVSPSLAFSSKPTKEVSPSGQVDLTIECRTPEGEVFTEEFEIAAESYGGYLPIRKTFSKKGLAHFSFQPIGLRRGDEVEISFGFATSTPTLTHKITVT